jgi:hypothetical protein
MDVIVKVNPSYCQHEEGSKVCVVMAERVNWRRLFEGVDWKQVGCPWRAIVDADLENCLIAVTQVVAFYIRHFYYQCLLVQEEDLFKLPHVELADSLIRDFKSASHSDL